MSLWPQAEQRTSLRQLLSDNPGDNFSFQEPVEGRIDGQNKVFRILESNVSNLTLQLLSSLGSSRTLVLTTDYTGPDLNGLITLSAAMGAPAPDSQLLASYTFQIFSDSDIDDFLLRAAQQISSPTNLGVPPALPTDGASIDEGLRPAMLYFAKAHGLQKQWTKAAARYTTSEKDHEYSLSDLAKNYSELIKEATKQATTAREDFYKRQGDREASHTNVTGYFTSPIIPRR